MSTISTTQGNTINISQSGGTIYYNINGGSNTAISTWPVTITNSTGSPTQVVKVIFTTDITFTTSTTYYFICGSTYIQFGSESLNSDGTRRIITIDGITNYLGLIRNGTGVGAPANYGKNSIYVYNLYVKAINSATLAGSAGWVAQQNYCAAATDNYIINCTADGNITQNSSGGIVGTYAGQALASVAQRLSIIGCSFTGTIGTGSTSTMGGIIGNNAAANSGTVYISNCFTTGTISGISSAGGITGSGAQAGCTIEYCYSTGAISGAFAGGIFGGSCTGCTARYCYSLGNIVSTGGGIFGASHTNISAINCYSKGTNGGSNGIVATSGTNPTTTNCYAAGGTWSDASAKTSLSGTPSTSPGVGSIWISTGLNTAYYLNNFGASPFTLNNIISNNIVQTISSTLTAGDVTTATPVANYKTFSIISGGDSTITISNTGVITTTSSTPAATYTLVIYAVDDYTVTTYSLTVNAAPILNVLAQTVPPCCEPNVCNANPQSSNYDSDVITNKSAGKVVDKSVENFYVGVSTGQRTAYSQPIFKSYYDYINYLQGKYK